jgi:nitrate reductase NapAB chaperone NapD
MTYKYANITWQGCSICFVVLPPPGIRVFTTLQELHDFGVQLQEGDAERVVVIDSTSDSPLFSSPGHAEIAQAFYQQADLREFRNHWHEGFY